MQGMRNGEIETHHSGEKDPPTRSTDTHSQRLRFRFQKQRSPEAETPLGSDPWVKASIHGIQKNETHVSSRPGGNPEPTISTLMGTTDQSSNRSLKANQH